MWTAHGIFSVLFNLCLVEAGASEAFVGRAISASAIGMVVAALPAGSLADRWGRRRTRMGRGGGRGAGGGGGRPLGGAGAGWGGGGLPGGLARGSLGTAAHAHGPRWAA